MPLRRGVLMDQGEGIFMGNPLDDFLKPDGYLLALGILSIYIAWKSGTGNGSRLLYLR
jgi:hypothetical protein